MMSSKIAPCRHPALDFQRHMEVVCPEAHMSLLTREFGPVAWLVTLSSPSRYCGRLERYFEYNRKA